MSEVWYILPSANMVQAARTLPEWKRQGYRVAVLQDARKFQTCADITIIAEQYCGWPWAVSELIKKALPAACDLIVTGGDDMYPDPNFTAAQIRDQFYQRFPDGFGVMQPIGDDMEGTDRICGSPWIGRGFFERINGGNLSPLWHGYFHSYADEELFNVATNLGVLWQRKDLVQLHDHWSRRNLPRPHYLRRAYGMWSKDQQLFFSRKVLGFPGHQPVPAKETV